MPSGTSVGGSVIGAAQGCAQAVGIKDLNDVKALAAKTSTVMKWCCRIMFCCLLMAGIAGCIFGVVLGIVFFSWIPDTGGQVLGAIGVAGGLAILAYCAYNAYVLYQLRGTMETVLLVVCSASGTKEELIQKLKGKVSVAVTDQITTAGTEVLFDELLGTMKSEMQKIVFGPPVLAVVLGIGLLVGTTQVDHDVAQTVATAIGIVLILGGCVALCIAIPVYCIAAKKMEEAMQPLKESLTAYIAAQVEAQVNSLVDQAADALVRVPA